MLISKFANKLINVDGLRELTGLELPDQYVQFLRKYNGGETPDTNWTGKCKTDVRGFYGYNIENKNWDIEEKLTYIAVNELFKARKLPVATNCSGDLFCIDCTDGSIRFVYHDNPTEVKVADDFKSFIAGCKSKKIGPIRTIEERTQSLLENFGRKPTEFQLCAWQAEIDKYGNMVQEEVIL